MGGYDQGGDSQAIQRVANTYFGSYANMFEWHGWSERGDKMLPAAQSHVVHTYGSVRAFEAAFPPGDVMFPMEALRLEEPNVWLTGFHEFRADETGFLGFADEAKRKKFIEGSKPGVLVAVYATGRPSRIQNSQNQNSGDT